MRGLDRSRETALWGWLKRGLKYLKPLKHDVQRIENAVATGTPDVEGCIEGKSFWCELKVAYPMANDRVRVKITPQQVRRALRRTGAKGRSWVLIRIDNPSSSEHFLIAGKHSEILLQPISRGELMRLSDVSADAAASSILKTMAGLE